MIALAWLLVCLLSVALFQAINFYREMLRIERNSKEWWKARAEELHGDLLKVAFQPPRLHVSLDLKTGKLDATLLLPTHPRN